MSSHSRAGTPNLGWKYDFSTVDFVIGYYVHHHGAGHLHRAVAVIATLGEPVTVLSSLDRPTDWAHDWVRLPLDTDGHGGSMPVDPAAGGALHWVPLGSVGLRARSAAISSWIASAGPTAVVVDVSVEVAALVRLHGVPVITFAQPGNRMDRAHTLGYQLSTAVIAPWTPSVRPLRIDPAIDLDVEHVGAISRIPVSTSSMKRTPRIAIMNGSGGRGASALDSVVAESMAVSPGLDWVRLEGETEATVRRTLETVSLVFAHCGQNAVAEIAASRVPAILIPESRPHEEQQHLAAALGGSGLPVIVSSPDDGADRAANIRRAQSLDGQLWSTWVDGRAAARAAAIILRVASPVRSLSQLVTSGSPT